jgi:hypothetical protein
MQSQGEVVAAAAAAAAAGEDAYWGYTAGYSVLAAGCQQQQQVQHAPNQ